MFTTAANASAMFSPGAKTGFEAFDADDKSLGVFETQRQAANALLVEEGGP
jgi:hypothetical protein